MNTLQSTVTVIFWMHSGHYTPSPYFSSETVAGLKINMASPCVNPVYTLTQKVLFIIKVFGTGLIYCIIFPHLSKATNHDLVCMSQRSEAVPWTSASHPGHTFLVAQFGSPITLFLLISKTWTFAITTQTWRMQKHSVSKRYMEIRRIWKVEKAIVYL